MFVFAALGVGGCSLPPEPEQVSVLLVTLDTTRADHLGPYGYGRPTTPNLDALAARGIVFEQAWAPMATTLPTHTSLMTGAWPLEHGVLSNVGHGGRRALPSDALVPIAQLFRDAGWQTAAFTSATPVKEGTGIERGFEHFDDPEKNVRKARQTTEAALGWLRKNGRQPFFVWVHYFDPHGPFEPPESFLEPFKPDPPLKKWLADRDITMQLERPGGAPLDAVEAHNGYDGEIRYMDSQLGRLLELVEKKPWGERTLIVVLGDHGEGLGQHALAGHGHVWAEQVHVPWIIAAPWLKSERISHQVSVVDVVPTLLSLMDVSGEQAWIDNASGHNALLGPTGPSLALSSLRQAGLGTAEEAALTVGSWRWVRTGDHHTLHHLDTDPYELVDLSSLLPVHAELMAGWLDETRRAQRARGEALGIGEITVVPEAEVEALRALGYLE